MSTETRSKGIRILWEKRLLILELSWGAEFAVALDSVPALAQADDEQLLDGRVTRGGSHVAWPALNLELSVVTLVEDAIALACSGRKRRAKR